MFYTFFLYFLFSAFIKGPNSSSSKKNEVSELLLKSGRFYLFFPFGHESKILYAL